MGARLAPEERTDLDEFGCAKACASIRLGIMEFSKLRQSTRKWQLPMLGRSRFMPKSTGCSALAWLFWFGVLGACREHSSQAASHSDSHSVALVGHLYSLYAPARSPEPADKIWWTSPIRSLSSSLQELNPQAVFFLGDNTRYSSTEEWDFIQRELADVQADQYFLPGNHDYSDIAVFRERGGLINKSIVIGRNKYLLLDAKMILEEVDLAFLKQELKDHSSYDHVFLLMHYPLPSLRPPQAAVDPYGAYLGVSNWNRDVVPLIAGKIEFVFCGDLYLKGIHRVEQEVGEHRIQYILNSFGFGRGHAGMQSSGDGPQIYLELQFQGKEFRILPHVLGLDVLDPWYRSYPRLAPIPSLDEGLWFRIQIADSPVAISLKPEWKTTEAPEGTIFSARRHSAIADQAVHLELSRGPLAWGQGQEALQSGWISPLADRFEELQLLHTKLIKVPRGNARWLELSAREAGQEVVHFAISWAAGGFQYVLSQRAPMGERETEEENFLQIIDRLRAGF